MIPITEIHPMLVHFPIVLWTSAECIAIILLLRGADLGERQHWPLVVFYALVAGTLFAVLAAVFGDIAKDHAVAAGFQTAPLERHEALANVTIIIFSLHTLVRLVAIWRGFALTGLRGWLVELPGLVGIVLLFLTAFFGGELVYHLGVNVAPVAP